MSVKRDRDWESGDVSVNRDRDSESGDLSLERDRDWKSRAVVCKARQRLGRVRSVSTVRQRLKK